MIREEYLLVLCLLFSCEVGIPPYFLALVFAYTVESTTDLDADR